MPGLHTPPRHHSCCVSGVSVGQVIFKAVEGLTLLALLQHSTTTCPRGLQDEGVGGERAESRLGEVLGCRHLRTRLLTYSTATEV